MHKQVAVQETEADKGVRLNERRRQIQGREAGRRQAAHPQRKRSEVPDAVNEAEAEDEASVVAAQPVERPLDTRPPARDAEEKRGTPAAANPEIELIPGKAAEPRG